MKKQKLDYLAKSQIQDIGRPAVYMEPLALLAISTNIPDPKKQNKTQTFLSFIGRRW
jgi:hypothetical protein